MKLGIATTEGSPAIVLLQKEQWINYSRAFQTYSCVERGEIVERPARIEDLLIRGDLGCDLVREVLAFLEIRGMLDMYVIPEPRSFLLPLRPAKIIALGRNYAAHAAETGHRPPASPFFFCKAPTSCIGPGQSIVVKREYGRVDPEAELAVVIGRRMKNVPPEDVQDCIAGYTILNDVTARDLQTEDIKRGHPWFRSKSIDTFCPLGPFLALPDEIPWPVHVDIELRVNGEVRQQSNTSMLVFDIPEVLAYISSFVTLEAGDIVSTGTPEGIAPIYPGDTVEISIPPVGVLSNPVTEG